MNSPNEGRWDILIVFLVMCIGVFALIVGWNSVINPPPKPTEEQLRQVKAQTRDIKRQLLDTVRQAEQKEPPAALPKPPGPTPFRLSDGSAEQKYERATALPPNWATQECVDIVVRYPNSPEAARAAHVLIEKWDHILHRDFLTLTGQRLPVDYDPPQGEVVSALKAAFQRRGVNPAE